MRYRAITGENFYFTELKNTCKFILENSEKIADEDIREELRINDILDCKSESNFKKKYQTINKRLGNLNKNLMEKIIAENIATGKFINLYAILVSEKFISEFMDEIIRTKYIALDYSLNEQDFRSYLEHKSEQSEDVESWSESGKKKMLSKIKTFLSEGGYLEKKENGTYKILKPLISNEVIDMIKETENKNIITVMLY